MFQKVIIGVLIILLTVQAKCQNKAVVEEKDGKYSIRIQNQILEIDPAAGGRITSLKIDGKDFLTGKEANDFKFYFFSIVKAIKPPLLLHFYIVRIK